MLKPITDLFSNLSVVGCDRVPPPEGENHQGGYTIYLESADSPNTLAITVSIPFEARNDYDWGKFGPNDVELPS